MGEYGDAREVARCELAHGASRLGGGQQNRLGADAHGGLSEIPDLGEDAHGQADRQAADGALVGGHDGLDTAPFEIRVGIITAILGSPYLLSLIVRTQRRGLKGLR